MKTHYYKELLKGTQGPGHREKQVSVPTAVIGHSRMVTDGGEEIHANNQPLVKNRMVVIHNGIVVNRKDISKTFPTFNWETGSDTEVIPTLLHHFLGEENNMVRALRRMYRHIEGVATIAVLFETVDSLLLATNNGSLYMAFHPDRQMLVFASEKHMLETLFEQSPPFPAPEIFHLEAGNAALVDISPFNIQRFSLSRSTAPEKWIEPSSMNMPRIIRDMIPPHGKSETRKTVHISTRPAFAGLLEDNGPRIDRLKRCRKCLLPETFPYIEFDPEGVCGTCKNHKKIEYKGLRALGQRLAPYKKNTGEPDIIVPLSGGRDSTFALHHVRTELGMNPVAYTYDWGMVTDLARRNISRVTAKLGVEHILVSADIKKKRRFIRQNVNAWLRRPRLGTLPLFMAGDKQFFYYANVLRKQMNIDTLLFGMNPLERTDFKVAFTGIREKRKQDRHYHLSALHKLRILFYYGKEYLLNPAFLNSSLADTLGAFISYYFIPHDYFIFYEYFPWDETRVTRTIIDLYNWETAEDTETTWRIGDGTASFYNYIYYNTAGFSENDTFRSNQVRQGIISREKALEKIKIENRPRYESIKWYCDTNGLDFERTVKIINSMPKFYP